MKKLKHFLKGCLISLLASSMFLGSAMYFEAAAGNPCHFLSFTGYPQAKDLWCWAACAETSAKHSVPNSGQDQWSAVKYVMGTNTNPYPNKGGSVSQMAKAANFIAGNKVTYVGETVTKTQFFLMAQLADDKMPVSCMYKENKQSGHALTLYGTCLYEDEIYLWVYDPGNGGSRRGIKVNDFYNGMSDGRKYEETCYIK